MENTWILKGGRVWSAGRFTESDVAIVDGRVTAIGSGAGAADARTVDCRGCYVLPGLVDVHVHLREPGFTAKETVATGTAAAARGGYTTVCAMPNLNPAPDSPEHLERELEAIRRDARVRVVPYGTITRGQKGRGELIDFGALAPQVAGFSDDGRGVQEEALMREAMLRVKGTGRRIVAHCEAEELLRGGYIHDGDYCRAHGHRGISSESEWRQVERDLKLVRETGCPYHVCHVSTRESVELIRAAKAEGLPVSCETAPHYLLLTDADLPVAGGIKMHPPSGAAADRLELLNGLADGTIEAIATDHAPHTAEEKSRGLAGSAMGIVGLECAFPLLYTYLVRRGVISLERLVELMSDNPRRLFGFAPGRAVGEPADVTVFDPERICEIDPETFLSKGRATPFAGWRVTGCTLLTLVGGRAAYQDEKLKLK